jgi:hypothetical protein
MCMMACNRRSASEDEGSTLILVVGRTKSSQRLTTSSRYFVGLPHSDALAPLQASYNIYIIRPILEQIDTPTVAVEM